MSIPTVTRVALPLAVDKTLSYRVPPSLAEACAPGCRVLVPLGKGRKVGVVVGLAREPRQDLREILNVLDPRPLLDEELLEFTRWVAEYYFAPWGQVLQAALPLALRLKVKRHLLLLPPGRKVLEHPFSNPPARVRRVLDRLASSGNLSEAQMKRRLPEAGRRLLEDLAERGWIAIVEETRIPSHREVGEPWVSARAGGASHATFGPRQNRALELLRGAADAIRLKELLKASGVTRNSIRTMAQKGAVALEWRASGTAWGKTLAPSIESALEPTAAQDEALAAVSAALARGGFQPFLLEGVTGSGKTEVYLRAAEAVRARGQATLYLVPEIGLTPLLAGRLEARFGSGMTILHSGLPDRERWEALRGIREGKPWLVLGTRSAVFAPLPRLGLIVVDEEQDPSYYQAESPRYHARDAALVRAQRLGIVAVLGSATPSLEAVAACRRGKFRRLVLPSRVRERPLPNVALVDMREEFRATGSQSLLSRELAGSIQRLKDAGDQGLLLLNRRGYATFLLCRSCGTTLKCSSCSIALTYHRTTNRLLCHYCNRSRRPPSACPDCKSQHLHLGGAGTQRVEETVRSLDPSLRIGRMDRDAVKGKGHSRLLEQFVHRELDLLVGTQMLAKGHDFPGVTLVGVLSADALLSLPDFRAGERTYQLLTQVAGRAGRGDRPGRVIIQAFATDHPALVAAATHRPEVFYERELRLRRIMAYPPWVALLQVRVESREAGRAERHASRLAGRLRALARRRFEVLGPSPSPLSRLKGVYRWQILLKGPSRRALADGVREVLKAPEDSQGLYRIVVEPDPRSLL